MPAYGLGVDAEHDVEGVANISPVQALDHQDRAAGTTEVVVHDLHIVWPSR
jgi:hypothetical protein